MATYSATNYAANGAEIRCNSQHPQWFSFTYKLGSTQTLASADVINFAKFGADQIVLQYSVYAKGSIAAATGNSLVKVAAINVSGNVADFGPTGTMAIGNATNAAQPGTTLGDALSLTLGTLTTATTSGTRSITLRVLVANKEASPSTASAIQTFPTLA